MRTISMRKRWLRFPSLLALAGLFVLPVIAGAQASRASNRLEIQGYVIDAELDPVAHHLTATAVVTFTAPESTNSFKASASTPKS